jgi:hypothetical protein
MLVGYKLHLRVSVVTAEGLYSTNLGSISSTFAKNLWAQLLCSLAALRPPLYLMNKHKHNISALLPLFITADITANSYVIMQFTPQSC